MMGSASRRSESGEGDNTLEKMNGGIRGWV